MWIITHEKKKEKSVAIKCTFSFTKTNKITLCATPLPTCPNSEKFEKSKMINK